MYIITLALLCLVSCKKVDFPNLLAEQILGEWEWKDGVGGASGNDIRTPESTGETFQLLFKENGKFVYCKQRQKVDKGTYEIEMKSTSVGEYLQIRLEGSEYSSVSRLDFITVDEIQLTPIVCVDCYVASFNRR